MVTVYHADLNEVQTDPVLRALFSGPTPFDRIEWLRLMASECLDPERCSIAVARDGEAVAALPVVQGNALESLANWYSFVARPRWTDAGAAPRLLAEILRGAGQIRLGPMPAAEARIMREAARRAGMVGFVSAAEPNHVLDMAGRDGAAWWASRPGQLRETVRRKGAKAALDIRIAHRFDPADWATYETVYAQSWKPAEGNPAFLRCFAEAEGAAGRLRLGLAWQGERPVAAQLWTVECGAAYIHKLAHVPDVDAASPGTLLSHAMFLAAIDEDRVQLIDFGTGDDRYKRDWVDTMRPRYRLHAIDPLSPGHWPELAKLLARRALRPHDFARNDPRLLTEEPTDMEPA